MASSSSQSIVLRYPTTTTGDAVAASASTPSAASGAGGFQGGQDLRLLEISNDLAKEIEQDMKRNGDGKGAGKFLLTIKGKPSDDAVICTRDRTFQIRSISVSNSLLLFQQRKRPTEDVDNESSSEEAAADQQPNIELQSTVREIMELLPMVPRLDRVQTLLSGTAWQGMASEAERQRMEMETPTKRRRLNSSDSHSRDASNPSSKRRRYTKAQLMSIIQASDEELENALRDRNVIEYEGYMLLLPPAALYPLLSLLLSLLTIHRCEASALAHDASTTTTSSSTVAHARAKPIIQELRDEHEQSAELVQAVMRLFGPISEEASVGDDVEQVWACDVPRIVAEIGKGLVATIDIDEPPTEEHFHLRWEKEVGEDFKHEVGMRLLEGHVLLTPLDLTTAASRSGSARACSITPLAVSSLPSEPANRFSDLFHIRPRWKPEDIGPFLKGLVNEGDKKAMDKLIVKFVRVVKEKDGVTWWYPRRT